MKRTDLYKSLASKIDRNMKQAGTPDRFGQGVCIHPFRKLVDAMHLDPELLRQPRGIRGVVAMGVGEQDVGRTLYRVILAACGEHRIAGQPGIDQEHGLFDFDAKAGMAEPGDLHGSLLLGSREATA